MTNYDFDVDFTAGGEDNDFTHAQKLHALLMLAFQTLLDRIRERYPSAYPLKAILYVSPKTDSYLGKIYARRTEMHLPLPSCETVVLKILPVKQKFQIIGHFAQVYTPTLSLGNGFGWEDEYGPRFSITLVNYQKIYGGNK